MDLIQWYKGVAKHNWNMPNSKGPRSVHGFVACTSTAQFLLEQASTASVIDLAISTTQASSKRADVSSQVDLDLSVIMKRSQKHPRALSEIGLIISIT